MSNNFHDVRLNERDHPHPDAKTAPPSRVRECPACDGEGGDEVVHELRPFTIGKVFFPCGYCNGRGKVYADEWEDKLRELCADGRGYGCYYCGNLSNKVFVITEANDHQPRRVGTICPNCEKAELRPGAWYSIQYGYKRRDVCVLSVTNGIIEWEMLSWLYSDRERMKDETFFGDFHAAKFIGYGKFRPVGSIIRKTFGCWGSIYTKPVPSAAERNV